MPTIDGTWRPWAAGDTAFWVRTDHPDHPRFCHVDDTGYFEERERAEHVAEAWNVGNEKGFPYPFYVQEVRLLPARHVVPDVEQDYLF